MSPGSSVETCTAFFLNVLRKNRENLNQCAVSSTQKFLVQQHITTSKHQANKQLNSKQRQLFLTQPTTSNVRSEFNIDLCRSLISADIPLYKLKNKVFREFLEKYTQHTIPDESTLRKTYAPSIYDETIQKIRDEIKDSSIWVSIDETPDKEGRLVGNVVIGLLSEQYSERILLHCDVLEKCNNKTIVKLFNETMGILWKKGIMRVEQQWCDGLNIGRAFRKHEASLEHLRNCVGLRELGKKTTVRRFEDTDVRRMPVQGRPWVTTPQEDRYLTLTARRNRTMPARQLSSELAAASGVRVSRQTVYRRLRAGGLCARRPAVCVQLTRVHIRNRLQWSQQHQHWTLDEWRNVLFTDESRFSLTNDSRCTIIWRERGTRFHPTKIVEKRLFCGGGVLVRAGIMFNGRTDLHIFAADTVNAQRYRDEVLERHVHFSEVKLVHTSSLWTTMHVHIEPTWWTSIMRGKIAGAWTGQRRPRI
ncbi:hypothetical protein ANN_23715 [Periplaneta americana]|uniref:Transposase Tc1-like domain-containing protein n=1 Tax=Periplaneta americana TaxID=6978 RepID=A0ABQ8SMS5_PERAM|nr:hypothetical protein ANN_23715 [Periplaneta americana]